MFAFLARLLALIVAVSVLRSAIEFAKKFWQGMVQPPPVNRASPEPAPHSTTLQQDPVCGTYVAADTSLKKIVSGHVYHFCSAECRAKFQS